ncbi:ATP synthase subunit I [Fodinibius saliphilus]|uniref:ATP synthase subunit I n=1 Tax=Fodinibius saliphilus TaxID=1920650 RepID=UPI001109F589|nr:ATP synthase subunit I [Fodinibius saliphilus]
MNWAFILIAIVSGAIISVFYFGGLWLTLRKIAQHRFSYLLLLVSFVVRVTFLLLVFYALLQYHWAYLGLALISFLIVRQILLLKLGTPEDALYN